MATNYGTGFGRTPVKRPAPVSDFKFNLDNSGNNAFGKWDDGFQPSDYLKNLLGSQYPGALNSGYFTSGWAQPNFERESRNAFDMLSPGGARARVDQFGRSAQEQATTSGMNQGAHLGQLGFGKSAQAGALLDAGNQARSQTSDFYNATADPLALSRQRLALTQNASQGPGMQNILQLLGMGKDQPGSPTLLQTGLGLFGSAIGAGWKPFSDRSLKTNVERVGDHPLGIGIYDYDIFGERERGVMADELLKVKPEAVKIDQLGYMHVDYDQIGGRP